MCWYTQIIEGAFLFLAKIVYLNEQICTSA